MGLNSFYRASATQPVRVYGGDFDHNGIYDMIPSIYLPDDEGKMKEFPAETRDDLLKQMTAMRKKFPDYKTYAEATMDQVLTPEEQKEALVLEANDFRSYLLKNEGNGRFSLHPLPMQAQLSVLNGMVAEDFDGDGQLDVLLSGNDFGTEPSVGRYDAFNGLLLKGDGKGNFTPMSIRQSGIFLPGDQKALVKLRGAGNRYWLAAGRNKGPLQVFELNSRVRCIPLRADDVSAVFTYRDGSRRKEEYGYGSSFLSESGRFLAVSGPVMGVEVTDAAGRRRKVL
jgi:hypothetical protein